MLSISAITLAELSARPQPTADPEERARRVAVLQLVEAEFDPLPFTAEAARACGRVAAAVLAAGRTPRRRFAGLLIASTAIAWRLPRYTTNPQDFAGLDSVLQVVAVDRPG
ncbi:VapC toxin family PIN domain ribonuclease [Amycolatopsis sp. PS_44_ISF1]|uniref:VapC toxin family PIN domain ribonuclease n=1 Tax=Amycolatopsis sp. PS_44_ISF1 TaxID=2974917 RepID=UPI0028DE3D9D|nr:VapC toxin family PIN domain ribonuclease [Amycolatopsis sp. PS_44_ISF1]MDT8913963.1 VapC toxin family PIN domain ribonuclease [Amycolatopsis sp. PS_44_ISF1]